MYFITPTDPKIILFGIYDTQLYGFGEKNGKLCIYTKAIFDIGGWKVFYLIDINIVKSQCCDGGLHVAGGVSTEFGCVKKIWIAARENEYTPVFSIDIDTKEFIRFEVFCPTNFGINLCSKCISPFIRPYDNDEMIYFFILPQKYKSNVGIFQIYANIDPSNHRCRLWKREPFTLRHQPLAGYSTIFMNSNDKEVISVYAKDEESGRLCTFSRESADAQRLIGFPDDDINWIWHEISFSTHYYLTRRNEGNKSFLRIYAVEFHTYVHLCLLDYCTVDSNFPSLDSTNFYISWRIVDEEYTTKEGTTNVPWYSQLFTIPSIVVFQTADGKSIVTISFRVLSLSEAAYLTLARLSHWPLQRRRVAKVSIYHRFFQQIRAFLRLLHVLQPDRHHHALRITIVFIYDELYQKLRAHLTLLHIPQHHLFSSTIATISIYDQFFQQIWAYLKLSHIPQPSHHQHHRSSSTISIYDKFYQKLREFYDEEEDGEAQIDPWMSQDFIKAAMGLPQSFSLTEAPNLPMQ